jgi:hypothetical protein
MRVNAEIFSAKPLLLCGSAVKNTSRKKNVIGLQEHINQT